MRIEDLRTGYIVMLRNGDTTTVMRDYNNEMNVLMYSDFTRMIVDFPNRYENETMKSLISPDEDIIAVYEGYNPKIHGGHCLYSRKEEEVVDWSKLKKDAVIYAKFSAVWSLRHFAKFENEKVYVYPGGMSSRTSVCAPVVPNVCMLLEGTRADEWDWSKVNINRAIYVKSNEKEDWVKRCYTGYEDGKVIASNGKKYPYAKIVIEV